MSEYLPLFPLDAVLFPDMLLPLHIFEQRYKEMIRQSLQDSSAFGIVYAHDEMVERIGCTAKVSKVIKRYPDGRMDIVASGEQRFRVLVFNSELPCLRATFEPYKDISLEVESDEQAAMAGRAIQLFGETFRLMHGSEPEALHFDSEHQHISFQIASVLFLANTFKQQILMLRSEMERLKALCEHMSALIPNLKQSKESVKRAGANGNFR